MNNSNNKYRLHYEKHAKGPLSNVVNMTLSSETSESPEGRRRGSRRAIPTTLLNANPTNFRALVQKFTGRSTGGGGDFVRRKGPVTLDFRSPELSSSLKEVIFPSSEDCWNYDLALRLGVDDESHVTWEGKETTSSHEGIFPCYDERRNYNCTLTRHGGEKESHVTWDGKETTSSHEVIFPCYVDRWNYNCALSRHVGDGESHVTWGEWEGMETTTYKVDQLSDVHALYGRYEYDEYSHGHHDVVVDDDLARECSENSSFNKLDHINCYHDKV